MQKRSAASKTFDELMTMGRTDSVVTTHELVSLLSAAGCAVGIPFKSREADVRRVYVTGGLTEWEPDEHAAPKEPSDETELRTITPAEYSVLVPLHVTLVGQAAAVLWMLKNFGAQEIDAMYRLDGQFGLRMVKMYREAQEKETVQNVEG